MDWMATLPGGDLKFEASQRIERQPDESLSQAVYRRLRREIVSGILRPNERLVEVELGERLEVSRTPVRDALMRLASDGLVDSSKRGWTVHEYNREELIAIFETRAALEGAAARLAAVRATTAELTDIERVLRLEAEELNLEEPDATVVRNSEFHAVVFRTCRNPRLTDLIDRNAQFYFNYRIAPLYSSEELQDLLAGHQLLLDALRERNGAEAERIQTEHLFASLEVVLKRGHW